MLFSLPPEVLSAIFNEVIHDGGIRSSVRIRSVCRDFNSYILEAIYGLPTFENVDDDSSSHLTWEPNMSKSLVAGVIRAKVRSHQHERALTLEILRTAAFVRENLADIDENIYIEALVQLAADNTPMYEVIRGLSRAGTSPSPSASQHLRENAFAASTYLGRQSDSQALMFLEANFQSRTKWFGDALVIAALHAEPANFVSTLRKALTTDDRLMKKLTVSRLIIALENAAHYGRLEIFSAELATVVVDLQDHVSLSHVLKPALMAATLACHDGVVSVIFGWIREQDSWVFSENEENHWIELLRMAASNGSEHTVRLILENTEVVNVSGSLNLALEDACRAGHISVLKLLLAFSSGTNLDAYAGALYWAARDAREDMLRTLFQSLGRIELSHFADALCGAWSLDKTSIVVNIAADWVPALNGLDLTDRSFSKIIETTIEAGIFCEPKQDDCATEEQVASSPSPFDAFFEEALPTEHIALGKASARGDVFAIHHIIALHGDEETAANHYSGSAFSNSIRHHHPGTLQYLCDKFPSRKHFVDTVVRNVQSTAMIQVLLDHGWNINETVMDRLEGPMLGNVSSSEALTKWFLDHEADPNKRCDWDSTPLSVAIARGPLSTIRLLLQHGGDCRKGQLLHYAVERTTPDQLAIIDMLLSFGEPLERRMFENDANSWRRWQFFGMGTPLHRAAEFGKADAVAYLLWRGADGSRKDSSGRTMIDVATRNVHGRVVQMLRGVSESKTPA